MKKKKKRKRADVPRKQARKRKMDTKAADERWTRQFHNFIESRETTHEQRLAAAKRDFQVLKHRYGRLSELIDFFRKGDRIWKQLEGGGE